MKKKTTAVFCMVAMMIGLSGCGNAIPDMSEEQGAIVAEYAAGLLLKYDKNYKTRLVEKEMEETDVDLEKEPEEVSKQDSVKPEEPSVSENEIADKKDGVSGAEAVINIGSFLELGAVQADYQGYEIVDSYAEGNDSDIAFAMNASEGAKLVVAKFLLTNTGTEDAVCDIFSKDVHFRIKYGTKTKNALVTMLSDDLSTLNTTIPAGGSVTAVLIIEVDADETESVTDLSLVMRYNDNSVETRLQPKGLESSSEVQQPEAENGEDENKEAAYETEEAQGQQ